MKKVLFVTAVPETINAFLIGYLNALAKSYDVHIATCLTSSKAIIGLNSAITCHHVEIARTPKISKDIASLIALYKLLRVHTFDVVHSVTPKAGLLSQISGFFARVPYRFHTFTGQVWVNDTGLKRFALKTLDGITAKLACHCLVDSPSQRQFLLNEGLIKPNHSSVLASGSISGVKLEKYQFCEDTRHKLRAKYQVEPSDFVFLFVGRLKVDKGIPELIVAFNQLPQAIPSKLFILGSDEDNLSYLFANHPNIKYLGFQSNVTDFYSFADVLCLPSHREGFGNVVIEAAAARLPTIGSNIYGLSDAIENGYSGLLHEVKNIDEISSCMLEVSQNSKLRSSLSDNGLIRVREKFDEKVLTEAFINFYHTFLSHKNLDNKNIDNIDLGNKND